MAHSYDRAHAARIDSSFTERALRRESTRAGHVGPLPAALSWIVLLVFVVAFATMIVTLETPRWLTALYGVMSVIAFFAYGFDKAAALRGGRRVSEQTLLTLGFAGGWPGALVAQQIFRHKTRKRSFPTAVLGAGRGERPAARRARHGDHAMGLGCSARLGSDRFFVLALLTARSSPAPGIAVVITRVSMFVLWCPTSAIPLLHEGIHRQPGRSARWHR